MKKSKTDAVEWYDGFVYFNVPILITNDADEIITIHGLLYNRDQKHNDDLWLWELNRFICYLQGCENVQKNQGKLVPEQWITSDGNIIALDVSHKNFIYTAMRDRMIGYKIVESDLPYMIEEGDTEDVFVISPDFIIRNGITPVIQIIEVK